MARRKRSNGIDWISRSGRLEDRTTPAFAGYYAVGAGAGSPPVVQVYRDGELVHEFFAYDAAFLGGVNVALGDFNGDQVPDVVTGPGLGGGPHVRVFSGTDLALIAEFNAYRGEFLGGVNVAVGDVTGDLVSDLVTAPASSGGPDVRVFDGRTFGQVAQIVPYDLRVRGGINVAVGDVNGDGYADVVTVPARGATHVRVFDVRAGNKSLQEFYAYDPRFRGGAAIAAVDLNLDQAADIITGPGSGGGPHVRVFSGAETGFVLNEWLAYDPNFVGGVRVGAADLNADGRVDVITTPGPGGGPDVRIFQPQTSELLSSRFVLAPDFRGGVTTTTDNSVFDVVVSATYKGFGPEDAAFTVDGTNLVYGVPAPNAIGAGPSELLFVPSDSRFANAALTPLGLLRLTNRVTDPGSEVEQLTLSFLLNINGTPVPLDLPLRIESTLNVANPSQSEDKITTSQVDPVNVRLPGLGLVAVRYVGFARPTAGPITDIGLNFAVRESRVDEVLVIGSVTLLNR